MRTMAVAAMCVLLGAGGCGDDAIATDGDSPDADGDGIVPDGDDAPVTVHLGAGDVPAPGIRVLFQHGSSALAADVETDAQGNATAILSPGSFITVVERRTSTTTRLRTVAGVMPGDRIELLANVAPIAMTVTLPTRAGASTYALASSCHSTSGAGPLFQLGGCEVLEDLVVEARDADATVLGHALATDVTITPNGTVDASGATFVDPETATTTVMLGAGTSLSSAIAELATPHGVVWQDALRSMKSPLAFTRPALGTQESLQLELLTGNAAHTVVDWDARAGSRTVDLATTPLTREFGFDFPTFDFPSQTFTWWTAPTGAEPTFAVLQMSYTRQDAALGVTWSLLAPGSTSATFPQLPAELAPLNRREGDILNALSYLLLGTTLDPAQIRSHLFGLATYGGFTALAPAGRVDFAQFLSPI